MTATSSIEAKRATDDAAWEGFRGLLWQKEINVRAFIQLNYTPSEGNAALLEGRLGLDYTLADATAPTAAATERACDVFRKVGLHAV